MSVVLQWHTLRQGTFFGDRESSNGLAGPAQRSWPGLGTARVWRSRAGLGPEPEPEPGPGPGLGPGPGPGPGPEPRAGPGLRAGPGPRAGLGRARRGWAALDRSSMPHVFRHDNYMTTYMTTT